MGILHCVKSGCAEVRYQPYKKAGGIRYRYPGEDWVTVNGDRYTIEPEKGACEELDYGFKFNASVIDAQGNPGYLNEQFETEEPGGENSFAPGGYLGKIRSVSQPPTVYLSHPYPDGELRYNRANIDFIDRFGNFRTASTTPSRSQDGWKPGSIRNVVLNFVIRGGHTIPDDCGDCVFTVYKDNEIIFQLIDPACPEAENLGSKCQLSDRTQVIQIEKLPYLDRIDVVDHAYINFGANVFRGQIPNNCLNIYKPTTPSIPPVFNGFPTPSNSSSSQDFNYGFVAQICSNEGCPPPLYQVICNCEGKECPTGSCPVECGNVVCCYDLSNGRAVAEIPKENYRGTL